MALEVARLNKYICLAQESQRVLAAEESEKAHPVGHTQANCKALQRGFIRPVADDLDVNVRHPRSCTQKYFVVLLGGHTADRDY